MSRRAAIAPRFKRKTPLSEILDVVGIAAIGITVLIFVSLAMYCRYTVGF